jgi:hypothetical protein
MQVGVVGRLATSISPPPQTRKEHPNMIEFYVLAVVVILAFVCVLRAIKLALIATRKREM